jgi:hypothetical protein
MKGAVGAWRVRAQSLKERTHRESDRKLRVGRGLAGHRILVFLPTRKRSSRPLAPDNHVVGRSIGDRESTPVGLTPGGVTKAASHDMNEVRLP